MSGRLTHYRGGPIFDGTRLLRGHVLSMDGGVIESLAPEAGTPLAGEVVDLGGDLLCPGYVDLQVNGGGGVMFNDDQSVETLRRIVEAHRRLGATTIFPTLITDTPERTRAAVEATLSALEQGLPGLGGLHLEGPHLSLARKGAHDPALIRPMTDADAAMLIEAARRLPALMLTIAPESVSCGQVAALSQAGAIVSLGHTDADYATCLAYREAGASCVTHLFNAMSQLGNREPGVVGAALQSGGLSAGLISDGIHVHPAAIRVALAAKAGPGEIFLVSDAMAPAGTELTEFRLNGRTIRRAGGRLQLSDGTLAGADLDLTTAVNVLVREVGVDLERALAMATSVPARVGRLKDGAGTLLQGARSPILRLSRDGDALTLREVMPKD